MTMQSATRTYLHLRDRIAERIAKGQYKENQRLPSERILAEELQTTRITLRDALSQLEVDGILFRMDRRGWFVAGKRLRFDPTEDKGFMSNVRDQGREPKTELLHCEERAASETLAKALRIKKGEAIYHLQRKRSIDSRCVLIEDIYLEASRYPGLRHANLNASLSLVLANIYGAKVKYSDIEITPVAFNELHAKSLQVSPGTPATLISRTSYDKRGRVVEFDREYWLSDVLTIVVSSARKGDR